MSLQATIKGGNLFTLTREEMLHQIQAEFPSELDRLKTAYSISASRPFSSPYPSPSMIVFASEFDEVNRTLVSVEALRKLHDDDHTGFVAAQDPAIALSVASFRWVRGVYQRVIVSADDLYTLLASIIINDLGKSPSLATELQHAVGASSDYCESANHDLLLHRVVTQAPHLIPCLAKLPPKHRAHLERGIEMGASFNLGQLAQAENVPTSLVGLDCMKENPSAFNLRFLEQILDIAGAAGHEDHVGAKKLTEPIFNSYKIVYEVSMEYLRGRLTRREAYDANLARNIHLLSHDRSWRRGQTLSMSKPEDRALMRLLCICNARTSKTADIVWNTFYHVLGNDSRRSLIHTLNIDGSIAEPAVQATYIPAVCSAVISSSPITQPISELMRQQALGAVFRYLARVQTIGHKDRHRLPDTVAVIERDIRTIALPIVTSSEFWENPALLDEADMPPCEPAISLPE
jgi:hypothetical protein